MVLFFSEWTKITEWVAVSDLGSFRARQLKSWPDVGLSEQQQANVTTNQPVCLTFPKTEVQNQKGLQGILEIFFNSDMNSVCHPLKCCFSCWGTNLSVCISPQIRWDLRLRLCLCASLFFGKSAKPWAYSSGEIVVQPLVFGFAHDAFFKEIRLFWHRFGRWLRNTGSARALKISTLTFSSVWCKRKGSRMASKCNRDHNICTSITHLIFQAGCHNSFEISCLLGAKT